MVSDLSFFVYNRIIFLDPILISLDNLLTYVFI